MKISRLTLIISMMNSHRGWKQETYSRIKQSNMSNSQIKQKNRGVWHNLPTQKINTICDNPYIAPDMGSSACILVLQLMHSGYKSVASATVKGAIKQSRNKYMKNTNCQCQAVGMPSVQQWQLMTGRCTNSFMVLNNVRSAESEVKTIAKITYGITFYLKYVMVLFLASSGRLMPPTEQVSLIIYVNPMLELLQLENRKVQLNPYLMLVWLARITYDIPLYCLQVGSLMPSQIMKGMNSLICLNLRMHYWMYTTAQHMLTPRMYNLNKLTGLQICS